MSQPHKIGRGGVDSREMPDCVTVVALNQMHGGRAFFPQVLWNGSRSHGADVIRQNVPSSRTRTEKAMADDSRMPLRQETSRKF